MLGMVRLNPLMLAEVEGGGALMMTWLKPVREVRRLGPI